LLEIEKLELGASYYIPSPTLFQDAYMAILLGAILEPKK